MPMFNLLYAELYLELTEAQYNLLANLVSGLIGAGSSIMIQWVAKRRSPAEEKNERTDAQTNAAAKNVATAIEVNNMLKGLLEKQRIYFDEQLEESRNSCHTQIESLRENLSEEYNDIMDKMKIEQRNVTDELTRKIIELRARLSKYEVEYATGKHQAIVMPATEDIPTQPPPASENKK
jgi:hypothetical protein